MAGSDASNKTEQATPERKRKAREDGQFARGRDAGGVAASLGVLVVIGLMGSSMIEQLGVYAWSCFREPFDLSRAGSRVVFERLATLLATLTLPAAGAAAIAAAGIGFAEAGFHPRLELAAPRLDRLDPLGRLKSMLAPTTAMLETVMSLARVFAVAWVAYATLSEAFPMLARLSQTSIVAASSGAARVASSLAVRAALALAVLALADYVKSRLQLDKQLMMSRQEIKDEVKQQEGDPRIRARIRARARERLRRAMAKQVRGSDVIVTNPTHVSVALRYRPEEGAPVVAAKGIDEMAMHIRRIAREADVPIVESPALARAINARVKVGRPIPVDLFAAVAQVLAFVYRLKRRLPWAR